MQKHEEVSGDLINQSLFVLCKAGILTRKGVNYYQMPSPALQGLNFAEPNNELCGLHLFFEDDRFVITRIVTDDYSTPNALGSRV